MRKLLILVVLGLVLALSVTGCAKRSTVAGPGGATMGKDAAAIKADDVARKGERVGKEDITGNFIEDRSVSFDDIYFDFDKFAIRADAKSTLKEVSRWLISNNAKIIIEGHCDERGTNEYNLGLGDRRANSTRDYLVASGVSPRKIEIVSYGEEKPQCSDRTESCWTKNRRAHFVVLSPK